MKKLFQYIKKYSLFYLTGFLIVLAIDYLQLLIPQLIGESIDILKKDKALFNDLLANIGYILLITAIVTIGRLFWRVMIFGTSRKIEYHIKNDLFIHLESLPQSFYHKNKTGDLMAYFTNDLAAVRMLIGPGLIMAFDAVIMISFIIFKTITTINLILTLLALTPLPLISLGALLFSRVIQKRFKDKQEAFAKMTDFVQESISGIRVIKAFVQEYNELKNYQKVNKDNFDKNLRLIQTYSLLFPIVGLIVGLSLLITLIYGSWLTITSSITLGSFVAFIQYIDLMIWPMIALGWCINIFSQGIASQKRIDELFTTKPDITDENADFSITKVDPYITIDRLTFKYPDTDRIILNGISLSIKKGEAVALVGKIGCGKTTLANLIARLYNAPEKSIYIGGQDINKIPLTVLKKTISYVTQDAVLFSDSIKNNITLAGDDFIEQDVINAGIAGGIHENIMELNDKYETIIGERGINISGGQKQRLTLARALILDPDILIIDDSLSAVDTNTEEAIIKGLKKSRKNKTTIIIAHRLSTIQFVDNIAVIENGRIMEYGSHKALLKNNGFYTKLYKKQLIEKELDTY
ncbi:MAG: ABC transporter ATP-binding protein [Spirochaetes bacterium]|nr:ABC transporter ATP-binding protein [Spirochaetota bacterium]